MAVVGIPRALAYHDYGGIWTRFFGELGVEVVLSPPTNKVIVDAGVKMATDGTCLPVKTFYGHVLSLLDTKTIDYIFTPRIVGVTKGEYICPKFLGLPDMVQNAFRERLEHSPRLLEPTIDFRQGRSHLYLELGKLALALRISPMRAIIAYQRALTWYYNDRSLAPGDLKTSELTIGVIGHGYLLEDPFISMELVKKLSGLGVRVIEGHKLPRTVVLEKAGAWPKHIFWRSGRIALGAVKSFLDEDPFRVDGVVYVASFGCGTDSLMGELAERTLRKAGLPVLTMNLDEHTGEAGVLTRLEAFVDLIKWRSKRSEVHVSTHG